MAYLSTQDEKSAVYYSGGSTYYSDAAASTLTSFTLAPGTLNTAYGLLRASNYVADVDAYSMGMLSSGKYTVSAQTSSWYFGSGYSGYVNPIVTLYNSTGVKVAGGFSGSLNFNVSQPGTYYVAVSGSSYQSSQYQLSYAYSAPVNYQAVHNISILGDPTPGKTVGLSGTYNDANGITSSSPVYTWFVASKVVSHNAQYTIQPEDAGKLLVAVVQIYDDAGYLETFGPPGVLLKALDNTAPSLTDISPSDSSVNVPIGSSVVFGFDEAVRAGSGSFIVKNGSSVVATILASDTSQVTFSDRSVILNPKSDLAYNTSYTLAVGKGAIEDLSGNAWAGTGDQVYDFKTLAAPLNGKTVALSGDPVIDSMTNGYQWALTGSKTVDWSMSNGFLGEYWINALDTAVKINTVLNVFSYYADINFNYVGYFDNPSLAVTGGSEINFSLDGNRLLFKNDAAWALGFFPKPDDADRGDIYLNLNSEANRLESYAPGSAGFFLLIHETGHTLGLKHPHDDGGTGRPTFSDLGWAEIDSDLTTVMSYADDYSFNKIAWDPATPMILDVLALQYLYGKNMTTNAGDSVYSLADSNLYATIWDASGSDTIDQSNALEAWRIALPEIQLSSKVDTRAGLGVPILQTAFQVPTTLFWLAGDIENVKGSRYSDDLTGNSFANAIFGNAGDDTIDGGAGTDTLTGGMGNDFYVVDIHKRDDTTLVLQDVINEVSGEGNDTLMLRLDRNEGLAVQTFALSGNLENLDVSLTGNNKINLSGNAGDNILTGNSVANVLDGKVGADTLIGGAGNDIYILDNANDMVFETLTSTSGADAGGIDTVRSSVTYALGDFVEHLTLTGTSAINAFGNSLDNTLTGNSAGNTFYGAAGFDTLVGGAGDDLYYVDLFKKTATTLALQDSIVENESAGLDTVILRLNADQGLLAQTFVLAANLENLDASLTSTNKINLTGNQLNNKLTGNAGANTLNGAAGSDFLFGGAGNDNLMGGIGMDTLTGDTGVDTLYGGADSDKDTFDFNDKTESIVANPDRVYNFVSGIDKLDLKGIDANAALASDQAFNNSATSALRTTYAKNSLWVSVYDVAGTNDDYMLVNADVDGVSGADFAVKLMGITTLKVSDIVL